MEQTHDTPSHDDEELDNVIPIHGNETEPDYNEGSSGAETEVLDVGITEEILTTDLIGGIRGYVDMSRKYLESSTSSITPTQLNDYMADNYEDSLTEEQRIAMAEFDVLLAKHGQTPARSVEGIVALRQMLVDAFKDNSLVPQQVQLELKELNRSIAVLEETYQSHLERSINESEAAAIASEQEREQAGIELKVTKAKGEVTVGTAEVEAKEQNVENKLRAGIADNNEGILGKTLDNDRLAKAIEAHKDSLRIIWQKAVRPILRPTIKTIVIVTIIGMTFSYFVETSGTEMYAILRPVNSLRHFIFDPIWGTIVKKFPQANT